MRFFSLFCFAAVFAASCTTQKQIPNNYLQNVSDTTSKDSAILAVPVIQKGDLLSIKIFSQANGINPTVDAPYNLQDQAAGGNSAAGGFLVDQSGNIEYPQLGILHVEGLTREEVAAQIKTRLTETNQLTNPSVIVRFINYRITILGEVKSPGTFTLPTDRVTILEALGLAGDVTEYGKKNTVKVVRENNGNREIGTIDLTSAGMFNSPYYRLQQNDVVFVEQTTRKLKEREQQNVAQQIGIATSIITAIALIITIVRQ
ncbi:MAG: polysaccharide biosynthesis/export family protein [Flavisolibacter sp.]